MFRDTNSFYLCFTSIVFISMLYFSPKNCICRETFLYTNYRFPFLIWIIRPFFLSSSVVCVSLCFAKNTNEYFSCETPLKGNSNHMTTTSPPLPLLSCKWWLGNTCFIWNIIIIHRKSESHIQKRSRSVQRK